MGSRSHRTVPLAEQLRSSEPSPPAERGGSVGDRASLHATVYGRVQAVGFRDFVWRQATALGLGGWVRNLPDGRSVDVRASGPRAALDELLKRLHEGPRLAHVSRVDVEWGPPVEDAGFEVRY